ncbi:MAG TPA: substrate-binding domain-containing protein [Usitatibacter sp.]
MKLDFLSAGAAHGLVAAIAAGNRVEVAGSFGAVGAMLEKFDSGEACDVVILTRAQVAQLASKGAVVESSVADLGAAQTAIAVRVGETPPMVSDGPSLRLTLLAADAIYFPDPAKATAGIHFVKVLDLLGLGAELAARIRTFPNGTTAMKAMGEASGHPIGCTQATEILAVPSVRLVAPLPKGFDLATVYTAAVSARASHRAQAEAFVKALTGAQSLAARRAAGFD